ncbi:hypothetical protein DY000_02062518 [Brassica cretica]|uniref:Uncharacterized protein n=1 Tax=Brassica cretica TaxID=69181 RepID=A0ABQ7AYT7_BRACR|nr:hypothetical protein DY000_02062518 [Brassica cretica]
MVSRNIPTAVVPRNIPKAYLLVISRQIQFLGIFRRQRFLGIFRRPKFVGIFRYLFSFGMFPRTVPSEISEEIPTNSPRKCFFKMSSESLILGIPSEFSEKIPRKFYFPSRNFRRPFSSTAHTNKHTGEIDGGVVRDVLSLIETQKEDEETHLSQLQTDLDATSTASTNLSRIRINEIVESSVPKKKGRLVGLGRQARSVPPSAPQPYVDPEVLMDQLKDKDDRRAALEQKMADQEAGWEATSK